MLYMKERCCRLEAVPDEAGISFTTGFKPRRGVVSHHFCGDERRFSRKPVRPGNTAKERSIKSVLRNKYRLHVQGGHLQMCHHRIHTLWDTSAL